MDGDLVYCNVCESQQEVDYATNECVCTECGLVLEEGLALDVSVCDRENYNNNNYKYNKTCTRRLNNLNTAIGDICDVLQLPKCIVQAAEDIGTCIEEQEDTSRSSYITMEAQAAAVVYGACAMTGEYHMTLKKLCEVTRCKQSSISSLLPNIRQCKIFVRNTQGLNILMKQREKMAIEIINTFTSLTKSENMKLITKVKELNGIACVGIEGLRPSTVAAAYALISAEDIGLDNVVNAEMMQDGGMHRTQLVPNPSAIWRAYSLIIEQRNMGEERIARGVKRLRAYI